MRNLVKRCTKRSPSSVSAQVHASFCFMMRFQVRLVILAVAFLFVQPILMGQSIRLSVDATEASRKIFHSHIEIPTSPGPLTLVYPKWLPGEHSPNGPLNGLADIHVTAKGVELSWRRDPLDMYAFHLDIPAGASQVEVSLDFLGSAVAAGFTAGASSTPNLAVVSWNQVLLYPQNRTSSEMAFAATLQLPPGWQFGTALSVSRESNGVIEFEPVSLTTLIDSPVLAGRYFRAIRIAPQIDPPHVIDLVSGSENALSMRQDVQANYGNLVAEAGAWFGFRHYRHYNFLVTLSDHVAFFGLEHHESSDDRIWEESLTDEGRFPLVAGLLPHEFVHSWNGKYRRPSDLLASNYQDPVRTDLLWVYEGLTVYLASVLSARSHLWTPETYREYLALLAATLDHRSGRTWRSLQDTADAAQTFYAQGPDWIAWRRSADFYDEGLLIWLEADAIIRQKSHGRYSLDDFSRLFFDGPNNTPTVKPYTFDDVVAAMNQIQPYDWRAFFITRLTSKSPRAPLEGIARTGWHVTYNDQRSPLQELRERYLGYADESFSIGMKLGKDGTVVDVTPEMAAAKAGIAPGMKVVAINERRWSEDLLRETIRNAEGSLDRINLLVENGGFFKTYILLYGGGAKFAHLERDPSMPDLLSSICKPLSPQATRARAFAP